MFIKFILCLQSDHTEMFHGIELAWEVTFEWTNCMKFNIACLDYTITSVRQ